MKLSAYCIDCGTRVTPKSKRCPKCGQVEAWMRRDKKQVIIGLQAAIEHHFRLYGIHRQCRYCRQKCKQWNAPSSEIIYCPRYSGVGYKALAEIILGETSHKTWQEFKDSLGI